MCSSDLSSSVTWRELLDQTIGVLGERPQARWLCETACGLDGDEFVEALDEAATERMVAQARSVGANAVINVRYSTASITTGAAQPDGACRGVTIIATRAQSSTKASRVCTTEM